VRAAADPAAFRRQLAEQWVARGKDLQPRAQVSAIHVAPPPLPPRPARLGATSTVGAISVTLPETLHEGMEMDSATTVGEPLIIAMSDLLIDAEKRKTRSSK
jgi:hypothetical protein